MVVGTSMANMALETHLKKHNIGLIRAKVGDRYVKEKMKKFNFNLGGEQSGHIILGKFATTGDGLLVALEVLFSLRKHKKASELLNVFRPIPQILSNVRVKDKNIINTRKCKIAIHKAEKIMKQQGRVLVRKSGTEPKIRIMVEAPEMKVAEKFAKDIEKIIRSKV